MKPVGPHHPDGVVVVEMPSHNDHRFGELLSGPEKAEFDGMLQMAGISRDNLFIVSAIACVPNEPRVKSDIKKALQCCRPLLQRHLREHSDDVPLLGMGPLVQLALDGTPKSVTNNRGFVDREWTIAGHIEEMSNPIKFTKPKTKREEEEQDDGIEDAEDESGGNSPEDEK